MSARRSHGPGGPLVRWDSDAGVSREDQVFLNERLAFFGALIAIISTAFLVVSVSLGFFFAPVDVVLAKLWSLETVFQMAAALVSGTQWLLCRKGRRSLPTLATIDAVGLWLVMALYVLMMVLSRGRKLQFIEMLVLTLITLTIVVARAVIVPASMRRTAAISTVACLPAIAASLAATGGIEPGGQVMTAEGGLYVATWSVVAVVLASASSRTIYGLRQQVLAATQLGQYTLEEKIGEGGMGAVYRARHALLRRPTAVKLLPAERAGRVQIQRFEKEVQLTSSLTHPNTISIFDYGHAEDGTFYYAMEYLDGVTLEDLVEVDGAQPPARVAHILAQAAGALAEAHEVGLIHRDVKPANIMLCARGGVTDHVKVLDFGLVKDVDGTAQVTGHSGNLSGANVLVGTPLYFSPEAITNAPDVDARSDLYALGCVAYFLLTGGPPFMGKSLIEICSKHLHSAPEPPSKRAPHPLPSDLEELVLSCLAKSPADRPVSADTLRRHLESLDLGGWTEDDGRTWWRRRAPEVKAKLSSRAPRAAPHSSPAATVAVDLTRRA
jgi:eukaryotic-like serine/threonine-protein kinase